VQGDGVLESAVPLHVSSLEEVQIESAGRVLPGREDGVGLVPGRDDEELVVGMRECKFTKVVVGLHHDGNGAVLEGLVQPQRLDGHATGTKRK